MTSEFRRLRRVEFCETDAAGILHFSNFFRYMEETEHEFLRSLGLSVDMTVDGRRVSFPRLAARCEFLAPLRFEDEVEIHLLVARKGRSSLTYEFEFTHGGNTVARGEVATVCCAFLEDGGMEATPLPLPFVEKLGGNSSPQSA